MYFHPTISLLTILSLVLLLLLSAVTVSAAQSHVFSRGGGGGGQWTLLHSSIGISAMHMQLLHNNKVVIFDRTDFGPSNISLPNHRCREDPSDTALQVDCTAHSVLYDIPSNTFRPLTVLTDVWCSSAAVLSDGTFLQTGGYNDGDRAVRTFTTCNGVQCDWVEFPSYLSRRRWYSTNQILPNGQVIILGGRRQFNYEFYPRSEGDSGDTSQLGGLHGLRFLSETRDELENNLYPFIHLLPDGNLFVFANSRSILLDYKRNLVVKEFPPVPGGEPRSYPSSGSSVLLPIDENDRHGGAEIMICGGAPNGSARDARQQRFLQAIQTCGRLRVSDENPRWVMETMPMPRVMGDMLLLPTGDVIIINGAGQGTAGWERGRRPVTQPVMYNPSTHEFSTMSPSPRPRMYHSSAILMPDARILVGGSNPHVNYNFTGVPFPTDLTLEAYSPPYLATNYSPLKPTLLSSVSELGYNQSFVLRFSVPHLSPGAPMAATLLSPSFTTHSFGMNQRSVVLRMVGGVRRDGSSGSTYAMDLVGPSTAEVAPPGYYLLFVVHSRVPSSGSWVRIRRR